MTLSEWIELGAAQGWCGPIVCVIHDGAPTTQDEDDEDDPCIPMMRVYRDEAERLEVERNHSPSVWRK